MAKKTNGSIKAQRFTMDIIVHTILIIMCFIWVLPFVYLLVQSFRGGDYKGCIFQTTNIVLCS